MCRQAFEIQKNWKPEKGDWYSLADGQVKICVNDDSQSKNGFEFSKEDNKIIFLQKKTWLPRQEQLIELSQIPCSNFQKNTFLFLQWADKPSIDKKNPNKKRYNSLEKARLAYIMELKYNKFWYDNMWYNLESIDEKKISK